MSGKIIFKRIKFPYIAALRPHQWTKNLVIFAAPLFAFNFSRQTLIGSTIAFILFCCTSSSFYLLNDIVDVEADRRHPVKCQRPIAAGLVSIPVALIVAGGLLVGALILGWLRSPRLGLTLLGYAIVQVAYNLKLKNNTILDIIAIAAGFVLRAFAGATATDITLSVWFLLCTAMLALFLAVEKRKAELRLLSAKGVTTRSVLKRYSLPLLVRMEGVVTTGTLMSYALWSAGPQLKGASTPWMMLTFPFVLYGIFRYQLLSDPSDPATKDEIKLSNQEQTERPDEVLLKDRPLLLTVISWLVCILVILGLKHQGIIK